MCNDSSSPYRTCKVEGCNKLGQHTGNYRKDGSVVRRSLCSEHHGTKLGIHGWDYKQYRKDYCENVDGRLGFTCTTTIIIPEWMLDTDHINGDHLSHHYLGAQAMQTLCGCCHSYKTNMNRDNLRKPLFINGKPIKNKLTLKRELTRAMEKVKDDPTLKYANDIDGIVDLYIKARPELANPKAKTKAEVKKTLSIAA